MIQHLEITFNILRYEALMRKGYAWVRILPKFKFSQQIFLQAKFDRFIYYLASYQCQICQILDKQNYNYPIINLLNLTHMGGKSSKQSSSDNYPLTTDKSQFQFRIDSLCFQISCAVNFMSIKAYPASKFKTQKVTYEISYTDQDLPYQLSMEVRTVSILAHKIKQLEKELTVKNDQLVIKIKDKVFSLPLTVQSKKKGAITDQAYTERYFQFKQGVNDSKCKNNPEMNSNKNQQKVDEEKEMLKREIQQLKREKQKLKNPQKKSYKSDVQNMKDLKSIDKIFKKAQQLYSQEKYKQCEVLALECLKCQQEYPGKISLQYSQTLHLLGRVKFSEQQNDKALIYYIEALQIKEKTIGRYHDRYTATLNNMGLIYKNTQKYDQALQCFNQCLQIEEQIDGKDNEAYMAAIANIGYVYMRQKKHSEALKYFFQYQQSYQRIKYKEYKDPKEKIKDMAVTLSDIATCYSCMNENEKCLTYRLKSMNFVKDNLDTHSLIYADKLQGVGTIYHILKRFQQSLQYYLKYIQLMEQLKETKHNTYVMVLCCIIETYEALNDMYSIVPICLKLITTCETNKDIDNETYLYGMDMLAKFLYSQKQYSEAHAMYKKLQTILSMIDKSLHQNYRKTTKQNIKLTEDALKSDKK